MTESQKKINFQLLSFLFFMGMMSFELKLTSISQLVETLSLQSYPLVILFQAIFLFSITGPYLTLAKKTRKRFFWINFTLSLSLLLICDLSVFEDSLYLGAALFLFSTLLLTGLDFILQEKANQQASLLTDTKFGIKMVIAFELGGLLSASSGIIGFSEFWSQILRYLPFLATPLFFHLLSVANLSSRDQNDFKINHPPTNLRSNLIFYSVGLFLCFFLTKGFQDFAFYYGVRQLVEVEGFKLEEIYSIFLASQTGLVFLGLIRQLKENKKDIYQHWSSGLKTYFMVQFFGAGTIGYFADPYILSGSGMSRKVLKKAFMDPSLHLFYKCLPDKDAMTIKKLSHSLSRPIALFILAVATYLYLNQMVSFFLLFSLFAVVCFGATLLVSKLSHIIGRHHVRAITHYGRFNWDKRSFTHSAKVLSYPIYAKWRPIVEKVLLANWHDKDSVHLVTALGRQKNDRSIHLMMNYYQESPSELNKRRSLEALININSYEVDLFFQRALTSKILGDEKQGMISESMVTTIVKRNYHASVLTALGALQKAGRQEKLVANAIEVLGMIAKCENDQVLFRHISKYLSHQYSKKVQVNTMRALGHSHISEKKTLVLWKYWKGHPDKRERTAIAYLAGELGYRNEIPWIRNLSEEFNHQNTTTLVALLKLGEKKSITHLAQIFIGQEESKAVMGLRQFLTLTYQERCQVYLFLFENFPDSLGTLLHRMNMTQREFNQDIEVIEKEKALRHLESKVIPLKKVA